MESKQFSLSLPPSPGRYRANYTVQFSSSCLAPSPEARDTDSFGLEDMLYTAASDSAAFEQFMPRCVCELASASSSRERPAPRKKPVGRGRDSIHPPPYMVWADHARSVSRQCPCERVDLKRPNKPPAAASSGRSWYAYQEEESFPCLVGSRRTAKAYLSISEMLSSTNCAILAAGSASRSTDHFPSSATVEGKRHFRFSPLRVAADFRHCTRGKWRPAFSPVPVFPALDFTASLGHASMHKDAVSSPPLRPEACPSLMGTFRAGAPCWYPPWYVSLRYLCRPSSIPGGTCRESPPPKKNSTGFFLLLRTAPMRLLSYNRKSLLFCSKGQ